MHRLNLRTVLTIQRVAFRLQRALKYLWKSIYALKYKREPWQKESSLAGPIYLPRSLVAHKLSELASACDKLCATPSSY